MTAVSVISPPKPPKCAVATSETALPPPNGENLESRRGGEHPDDDDEAWSPFGAAPSGAPLAYRAAEANAMAEELRGDDVPTEPPIQPKYLTGAFDDEATEAR